MSPYNIIALMCTYYADFQTLVELHCTQYAVRGHGQLQKILRMLCPEYIHIEYWPAPLTQGIVMDAH